MGSQGLYVARFMKQSQEILSSQTSSSASYEIQGIDAQGLPNCVTLQPSIPSQNAEENDAERGSSPIDVEMESKDENADKTNEVQATTPSFIMNEEEIAFNVS